MSMVIKAGEAGRLVPRLSTIALSDHLREANAIVERARQEAAKIVAEASEQSRRDVAEAIERARREGYEKGQDEGTKTGRSEALEQGRREFAEQHASLVSTFRAALGEVEANKEQLRLAAERDLLEFAVAIATKLTFSIGELHHEAAQENFARALALVSEKSDLTVRCHPRDIEALQTYAKSFAESASQGRRVLLAADESVAPGGCVLRCGKAEVDASLDTQIAAMVRVLIGEGRGG